MKLVQELLKLTEAGMLDTMHNFMSNPDTQPGDMPHYNLAYSKFNKDNNRYVHGVRVHKQSGDVHVMHGPRDGDDPWETTVIKQTHENLEHIQEKFARDISIRDDNDSEGFKIFYKNKELGLVFKDDGTRAWSYKDKKTSDISAGWTTKNEAIEKLLDAHDLTDMYDMYKLHNTLNQQELAFEQIEASDIGTGDVVIYKSPRGDDYKMSKVVEKDPETAMLKLLNGSFIQPKVVVSKNEADWSKYKHMSQGNTDSEYTDYSMRQGEMGNPDRQRQDEAARYEIYFQNGKTQRFLADTPEAAKLKALGLRAKSLIKITFNGRAIGKPISLKEADNSGSAVDLLKAKIVQYTKDLSTCTTAQQRNKIKAKIFAFKQELKMLSTKKVVGVKGIYEPITDSDISQNNIHLQKSGGKMIKSNGTLRVLTDDKKVTEASALHNVHDDLKAEAENKRNAEQLEIGDVVEITGDVQFKGQTGELSRFGHNKKFVIVKLYNSGEHSFHASDVSEADLEHEEDTDGDEEEHTSFYVAFYDNTEERSWIGLISRENGGKWHEHTFKGKPEYRWGQSYMSYLSPDDIMSWIHKDYGRSVEIEGPFYSASEAEEHVRQNWGTIKEGFMKDFKRKLLGKDAKSRAGEELTKGFDALLRNADRASKKHFDHFDKLDNLANKDIDKFNKNRGVGAEARKNQANVDASEKTVKEDVEDEILHHLTTAKREIDQSDMFSADFKQDINTVYNALRKPILKNDLASFAKAWDLSGNKHPDAWGEFIEAVLNSAKAKSYADFAKKVGLK